MGGTALFVRLNVARRELASQLPRQCPRIQALGQTPQSKERHSGQLASSRAVSRI